MSNDHAKDRYDPPSVGSEFDEDRFSEINPGEVFRLFRDTAQLSHDITVGHDSANYSADAGHGYSFNFLDSPDTTAMVYYCLKYRTQGTGGQSVFYNRGAHLNATNENGGTAVSSIMLMELDFA